MAYSRKAIGAGARAVTAIKPARETGDRDAADDLPHLKLNARGDHRSEPRDETIQNLVLNR